MNEQICIDDPAFLMDWVKDGTSKSLVAKEATEGAAILARLRGILEAKFQHEASKEYDPNASDRTLALAAGYRKALKDIYRLVNLDT